jgi:flagellin-like protein
MLPEKNLEVGGQKGITGLGTAIIPIAFVVVASVFAFTVLSTGIFASERSNLVARLSPKKAESIRPRQPKLSTNSRSSLLMPLRVSRPT